MGVRMKLFLPDLWDLVSLLWKVLPELKHIGLLNRLFFCRWKSLRLWPCKLDSLACLSAFLLPFLPLFMDLCELLGVWYTRVWICGAGIRDEGWENKTYCSCQISSFLPEVLIPQSRHNPSEHGLALTSLLALKYFPDRWMIEMHKPNIVKVLEECKHTFLSILG